MVHKQRLLVVDDDALNARTLSEIFTLNGYETRAAFSGHEALEMIKREPYSCVLSDIRMNGMSGVELLRAAKAIQANIVFILMTAYTDSDLLMEGIREGALVTLIKPLDINRLLAQVGHVLKQRNCFQ